MFKSKMKRGIALLLTMCMVMAMMPTHVFAVGHSHGDTVVTPTDTPPAAVEGFVWVLTDSVECKSIVHTHKEGCFYKSCDHKDGHLSTCYSESTSYALCEHEDETQHTGSVTLTDVVEINGTNVTWKTEHPAYPTLYAIYKAAYDEAYANAKFLKEVAAKAAGVAALVGKTFCYTTSASATPDLCTHGTCSDYTGACYSKLCLIPEHTHVESCFQYTWTLKTDMNKNGVADDADEYFVIKYVVDGETVYEEAVLVGMPTPTVKAPAKEADAQYTYEFAGWDTPVAEKVTEDMVYTAVFTNIVNKYTVTWKDEDGKTLETDKDVEYGQMPKYDGELPAKKGDNTIVYTFAGWTPSVETVTGNVTYTATYTSKAVHAVEYYIDNELQKTEYVVEGEKAPAYEPTRAHYMLTPWMNGDALYDFDANVNAATKLYAEWKLVECVVTVKAPNASYTYNGTGVYNVGEDVVIKVMPKEGYAVSKILVNGTSASLSYDDGVATVKFTPDATTEKYLVDVKTEKVKLALNAAELNVFGDLSAEGVFNAIYDKENSYPELKASDVTVEYLAYSIELMGKTYEWWTAPGTEVSLQKFLDQYKLGALASYIPTESLPHEFGAESTERVRVSYAGSEKYPAMSAETTVALIDMRTPTTVNLHPKVNVVYGATAEDILKLVFKNVVTDDKVITEDYKNVEIQMDSLNAGTRKATVSFKGDKDYAPSVAEIEVTISKATGELSIQSYNGKYGTDVNVSELFTSNANRIEIAMGMFLGENASADAGTAIYVNLPTLMDVDSIEDETIRKLAESVIESINKKLSGTMTVAELKAALENALPYIETIEEFGYEINVDSNTVNLLIKTLDEMSKLEGVGDVYLQVTMNQDIVLKDAGAYLLAGLTADHNYTTMVDGGYVIITPNGYRAELEWNVEDKNGIITLEALRDGYDLGAHASFVYEGSLEEASAHVRNVFFGVNKNGEMVLTQDASELEIGAYAQMAFLVDMGNNMYYAEPIVRAFLVAADVVNVQFVDANGKVNNDRVFKFGEDATMNAVAFDRVTGKVEENGVMTYMYMGVQANGEIYRDAKAPTRPGVYTVLALFVGEDEMTVGANIGALVIEQIDPEFTVEDNKVVYDGKEHNVTITDNTGMNRIYVVVDEDGNMNVMVPNQLHAGVLAAGASMEQLLEKIESLNPTNLPEVPEELRDYYTQLSETVKSTINQMKKECNVKSVSMNAPFPTEIGVYKFAVIGYKDAEHKIAAGKATLTIYCEHVYDSGCDADCNLCGEERKVSAHKETYIDRFESTCVKQGYEKIRCKECHEVLSETTLPLSEEHAFHNGKCLLCGANEFCEHDYVVVKELKPTCKEAGYVWTECSICGAEKNYEVGEPTGEHGETYIDRFDSSCVKHGYEKTRCKVCDEVLSEVELPLSEEHAFYNGKCLLCGVFEKCQHEYETVREQKPTCGEAGYVWTTCTKCGEDKNYEVGEPTGEHTFDNACDTTCNGCELTRTVEPHKYEGTETKAPTCGRAGEMTYVCSECGDTYTEAIKATGAHEYDNLCDATCNVCGELRTPSEHVYDNACDTTCNNCGNVRQVAVHPYVGKETKAPTCGTAGEMTYTCPECGASYDEEIPATGEHTYDNDCDAVCNGCHFNREVGEHQYEGVETKKATCGTDGEMTYTCSVCKHSYTEAIKATGEHVYNNACDATCNDCGAERTPAAHVYDDEYDATCNVCGFERQVPEKPVEPEKPKCEHEFDNDCDTTCNLCGDVREVGAHAYDNDCDADCNVCGATREVPAHVYDNDCDATCNICAAEREVGEHVYDDEYDADCNVCGATREVSERPTEPSKPDDGGETPPQTGDNSHLGLWIILLIASAAGIFFILFGRKRRSGKYSE